MEESFYFFPKPLWKLWEGAEWKEASLHRLRSILGRTPDLQGTRGLISWSGNTIAYTCNVSIRSWMGKNLFLEIATMPTKNQNTYRVFF